MGTTPQPTCALGHQGPTIFLKCEESNIRKGKEHVRFNSEIGLPIGCSDNDYSRTTTRRHFRVSKCRPSKLIVEQPVLSLVAACEGHPVQSRTNGIEIFFFR
jgi:hypothetical protein